MSLQNWLAEGRLKNHTTSKDELRQLFAVYRRDMTDAQMEELSDDASGLPRHTMPHSWLLEPL